MEVGDYAIRQVHAHVGPEEKLFDFVDEIGVDSSPREEIREAGGQVLPGPPQGGAQPAEQPGPGSVVTIGSGTHVGGG